MYFRILSSCSFDACAPTIVSVSSGSPRRIFDTRSMPSCTNSSAMDSWTSARDGQVHTSPWLRANMAKPSTAFSRNASSASMMSSKKRLGLLPPSSSVTGTRLSAAAFMIVEPVVVSPVNATFEMRSEPDSAAPASSPKPLMTLSTPSGNRSPMISIRCRIDAGVYSAGLSTMALPAASAGASFHVAMRMGKFHGMIWPTTPSGSWKWYATRSSSICDRRPSCVRAAAAK